MADGCPPKDGDFLALSHRQVKPENGRESRRRTRWGRVCLCRPALAATRRDSCSAQTAFNWPAFAHILCAGIERNWPPAQRSGHFGRASMPAKDEPVVIKKYANRRLYNTGTSTYVTLEDLAEMVKKGEDFNVQDAKTGEDITHPVLTQIIFELENKDGQNMLPIPFLRQLISFYGDQMQMIVPSFLEQSMVAFAKEQERFREQMKTTFGKAPIDMMNMPAPMKAIEEQARRNMDMFQNAMRMFSPFPAPGTTAPEPEELRPARKAPPEKSDDLADLKEQIAAMQRKLDSITK
jgi:polyhydroxyalkanoate synthesis repressor PhaR